MAKANQNIDKSALETRYYSGVALLPELQAGLEPCEAPRIISMGALMEEICLLIQRGQWEEVIASRLPQQKNQSA